VNLASKPATSDIWLQRFLLQLNACVPMGFDSVRIQPATARKPRCPVS